MTPVEHPPLPFEKAYNPLVIVSLIGGVFLVVAFFLGMLFLGIGKDAQVHRLPAEKQLPANVPD
jgi:hypothetical protein